MMAARLLDTARAHAPMVGAAVTDGRAVLRFAPEATAAQRTAAQAAVDALDWSPAAVAQWQAAQQRPHEVARITGGQGTDAALRALALVVLDELNLLRAQHGLAARTLAQLKAAIVARITAGDAD